MWLSTVRGEIPRRFAICRMVSPSLINIRTSCSRGVSDARDLAALACHTGERPQLAERGPLHLGRDDALAVQHPADLPADRGQRGGLDQVPLDTQTQRLHDGGAVRPVGEHDDDVHQLPIVQPADRIEPVGQGDVQDGDVRAELIADGQHRETGVGLPYDLETGQRFAGQADRSTDDRVRVGDDEPRRARRPLLPTITGRLPPVASRAAG